MLRFLDVAEPSPYVGEFRYKLVHVAGRENIDIENAKARWQAVALVVVLVK